MYRAKIVLHSSANGCPDLITAEVEYPRCILAEVTTHRKCRDTFGEFDLTTSDRTTTEDMNKNSASSRAIPFKRMLEKVIDDPYVPERFTKNGPGMQGHGFLEGQDHDRAVQAWLDARDVAIHHAQKLHGMGVHKQDVNRLLEPFGWVTQILTADSQGWANFFALRCHADAAPAFQKVARMLYLVHRKSQPTPLTAGQWHLPYVTAPEFDYHPDLGDLVNGRYHTIPDSIQFSAARCAWVSYANHDKDGTPEQMRATFQRMMGGDLKHGSPCEHQASPRPSGMMTFPQLRSNLTGWLQARKLIKGERVTSYEPSDEEIQSWGLSNATNANHG